MTVKLSPIFNGQLLDENGAPAVGWKIKTCVAGSSQLVPTFTDSTGSASHTNPIICDALGFPGGGAIWVASGTLVKFIVSDENDALKYTVDAVSGVNDAATAVNQWGASGFAPTYISPNSLSLSGDQTTDFHVGRRLQFTTTAGTVYGAILTSTFAASLTTVTMQMEGGGVLDGGLTVVNLSILRADHPATPVNAGLRSFRNKLINGDFSANQHAVTGSVVLTAGQYGHDGWKAGAAGCSYTFATVNNITTLTITAGSMQQIIFGRDLQSGTHALSWVGTAQGKIGAGAYSASGVTGAAAGGTNLTVEFNTGTLSFVQLEPGAVSTLFEQRPQPVELSLCKYRYGTGQFSYRWGNGAASGWVQTISIPTMAAVPTVTASVTVLVNAASFTFSALGASAIQLGASIPSANDTQIIGTFTTSAEP